jgi:hypothetical protein
LIEIFFYFQQYIEINVFFSFTRQRHWYSAGRRLFCWPEAQCSGRVCWLDRGILLESSFGRETLFHILRNMEADFSVARQRLDTECPGSASEESKDSGTDKSDCSEDDSACLKRR